MVSLCDLPPFVIDQVIGTRDTSYVVIKLWLCGNRQHHSKLSTGLTFLELQGHPLGTFCFPKLIKHLRSLRMFSISGNWSLIRKGEPHTSLIESLPPTLEHLTLCPEHDVPKLIWNQVIVTQYPRGPSESIDLEALFPRLKSLKFYSWAYFTSDFFPALPSSLTSLDASIELTPSDTILMSALPPNLRILRTITRWRFDSADENASFEAPQLFEFSSKPSILGIFLKRPTMGYSKTH